MWLKNPLDTDGKLKVKNTTFRNKSSDPLVVLKMVLGFEYIRIEKLFKIYQYDIKAELVNPNKGNIRDYKGISIMWAYR
jgi:hypothetical protein